MSTATATRERPILFSGPMVCAINEGRKTQTRRIIDTPKGIDFGGERYDSLECGWFEPTVIGRDGEEREGPKIFGGYSDDGEWGCKAPWWPGDRLWVRESLRAVTDTRINAGESMPIAAYAADGGHAWTRDQFRVPWRWQNSWLPSIHMPRELARIFLRVTDVRVERLCEISEADAMAEGLCRLPASGRWVSVPGAQYFGGAERNHKNAFGALWESLHGPGSWAVNPWVWVVSFKREKTKPAGDN